MLIGHRGFYDDYIPENSFEAFKICLTRNIPIELDIRMTKDKKLIVFHDSNTFRMCKVSKIIEKTNYDDLKKLKLKKSKETIPLLIDVLNLVNDKVLLLIEIKGKKEVAKEVLKITNKYKNIYFHSFNKKVVNYIKKKTNKKVGLITFGIRNVKTKADFISVKCENAENIKNKELFLWNIEDKKELEKYRNYNNYIVYIKNFL